MQVDYERGRRVVGGKRKDGEVGRLCENMEKGGKRRKKKKGSRKKV